MSGEVLRIIIYLPLALFVGSVAAALILYAVRRLAR